MQFENPNIQDLVAQYRDFSVEGFNIFATGKDHLPHLICVCPNKAFARAIQALLTIAKQAHDLPKTSAQMTTGCLLSPAVLADGTLALVATLINDAVWRKGNELEYEELELQLGTSAYQNFVTQFLPSSNEASAQNSQTTLHVYEDTLILQDTPKDEFPF